MLPVILIAGAGYGWSFRLARRDGGVTLGQACWFGIGLALAAVATIGPMAVDTPVLFWVRALQVLLLLYVAPFFLALGRPVATVSAASESVRRAVERFLTSTVGRVACSPAATSIAMLATPWLLYLTPWYVASMTGILAEVTRLMLVLVGFGYFYTRLQADPVPHRYSPMLSIGISVGEGLADGVLGVVLWLGPLVAGGYYAAVHRNWGPSMRVDQSIGAGILWIVGDVFGMVFILVLMRALGQHERHRAAEVDAELGTPSAAAPTLWWENDPQLRDRFGTR